MCSVLDKTKTTRVSTDRQTHYCSNINIPFLWRHGQNDIVPELKLSPIVHVQRYLGTYLPRYCKNGIPSISCVIILTEVHVIDYARYMRFLINQMSPNVSRWNVTCYECLCMISNVYWIKFNHNTCCHWIYIEYVSVCINMLWHIPHSALTYT